MAALTGFRRHPGRAGRRDGAVRRGRLSCLRLVALWCCALLPLEAGAQALAWTARYNSGFLDSEACPGACENVRGQRALALDAAGNAYVTGYASNGTHNDYRTIKYAAADGSVLWSVGYDGPAHGHDAAYAIALDESGNAYVTGYSWNGTNNDYRTIKYAASDGSVLWSVGYNGPTNDDDQAVALALDAAGNAYVTGQSYDGHDYDYRTIKHAAADGSLLWSVAYAGAADGDDQAYAIAVDGSGQAYVTGHSWNGSDSDYRTIKYAASDGSLLWSVAYAGAANGDDQAYALALDAAGNAYVTGQSHNGSSYDYRTLRYAAADGSVLWSVAYAGPAGNDDVGNAIAVDGAGDAYVAGVSANASDWDYRTVKYAAADGSLLWSAGYDGGEDVAQAIALDGTGNAYVTGYSSLGGLDDYRTVKYAAADGSELWSVGYDGPGHGSDVALAIAVDGAGQAWVAGRSYDGTNDDFRTIKYASADGGAVFSVTEGLAAGADDRPGDGDLSLRTRSLAVDGAGNTYVAGRSSNGSNNDARTVKYSPQGSLLWSVAYNHPANGSDALHAIAVDGAGNAYVTGHDYNGSSNQYRTIKYASADGSVLWSVAYDGPANGDDLAYALALDGSGNAYVTGFSADFSAGGGAYNYRTIKYAAADGSELWSVGYDGPAHSYDVATAIAVDGAGNAYVTGYSYNGSDYGYRTVKYASADGAVLWSAGYEGPANGGDYAYAIALDAAGDAHVTGLSSDGGNDDFRTVKYASADGAVLWSVAYNGVGNNDDRAYAIAVSATGDAYVTGYSYGGSYDYRTIKYAPADGSVSWSVGYDGPAGGHDYAYALALDGAGNAYVAGYSSNGTDNDYRAIKYAAADGAVLWSTSSDGLAGANDQAYSIAVDGHGNATFTGSSWVPTSGYDFLTVKYASDSSAPANPSGLASTTHAVSTWSNLGSIGMQWSGAADEPGGSGLAGYSVLFDEAPATAPDTTVDVAQASDPHATASAPLPDGASHSFHLRTCDQAGNCSGALHSGPYFIDRSDPGAPPALASTSHTTSSPSGDRTVDIQWGAAADPLSNGVASGIDGYSWFFDGAASPSCDQTKDVEEGTTTATSAALANGSWYAHVCARDNAGNWSELISAGPYVIEDQADLSMVKTDSADPVPAGASFDYGLAVSNAGPSTAQSLTVTDALPAGVTYVSASGTGWSCGEAGGTVTCTRADLAVGAAPAVTITVAAPAAATTLDNTASVSATTTDPAAGNNSEGESTAVAPSADLSVSKTDGVGTATPGTTTTYTIVAANAGPSDVASATLADIFPGECGAPSWSCVAAGGATCAASGSGSIADTPSLPVGGSATYTAVCPIVSSATGTLSNTASISSPVADPSSANDTATDSDSLTAEADLSLALADGADPIPVYGSVTYTAAYANAGPSDASGATLSLTLPAGLGFVSSAPGTPTCTPSGGVVSCALAGLASGAGGMVTVTARAEAGTLGSLTVNASVTAAESDPVAGNNADSESTLVKFVKGDLQNDLQTDLYLGHTVTRENRVWLMNGTVQTSEQSFDPATPASATQQVVGVDDFDHDRRNDLVFWDTATGAVEFWLMNGVSRIGMPVPLSGAAPLAANWKLSATADFNADGWPDVVWRNFTSQKLVIWTMNGTTKVGNIIPTPSQATDYNWEVVGAFDMNGDAITDFLWYNWTSGKIVYWWMNAAVQRVAGNFTTPANAGDNNWKVLAAGDYGSGPGGMAGTADVVWRNASSGRYVVWYLDLAGHRTSGTFTTPLQPPVDPTHWTIVGPR